jgi:hypothetical protein
MMRTEDLTAEVEGHVTRALLKHQYEGITFTTTIIKSKIDPETTHNAGHGFIRISLCDLSALEIAKELCLYPVGGADIIAKVPKAVIPKPKIILPRTGPNEKKLSKIRNRERKFDKLREFIQRISATEGFADCDQYKPISSEHSSSIDREISWRTIPSCVDPAHNFIRNEPLGQNAHLEELIRESRKKAEPRQSLGGDSSSDPSEEEHLQSDNVTGRNSALSGPEGLTTRAIRKRSQIESFLPLRPPAIS